MTAPYAPGDTMRVWHTCADHEAEHGTFTVKHLKPLTSGRYRVTTTRCDGTQMDVEVDAKGRDLTDVDVVMP